MRGPRLARDDTTAVPNPWPHEPNERSATGTAAGSRDHATEREKHEAHSIGPRNSVSKLIGWRSKAQGFSRRPQGWVYAGPEHDLANRPLRTRRFINVASRDYFAAVISASTAAANPAG
jgi:hypothetical protein